MSEKKCNHCGLEDDKTWMLKVEGDWYCEDCLDEVLCCKCEDRLVSANIGGRGYCEECYPKAEIENCLACFCKVIERTDEKIVIAASENISFLEIEKLSKLVESKDIEMVAYIEIRHNEISAWNRITIHIGE